MYIKDIYHLEEMNPLQQEELSDFDKTYCYNTPSLTNVEADTSKSGFSINFCHDITDLMYRRHTVESMFEDPLTKEKLTEFGKLHYRGFRDLPVKFYELSATKK